MAETNVEWTVEKLVRTAQAHDSQARRQREKCIQHGMGFDYSSSRKLAFDARKWARQKVANTDNCA